MDMDMPKGRPLPEPVPPGPQVALHMLERAVEYKELRMMYSCAIKEVETKLQVLMSEYSIKERRSPISSIQSRLKSSASVAEKLMRKGADFSPEELDKHIQDIAGLRVICPYVDDVYTVARALTGQDDVTLLEEKDYIKAPKPNGYRSLHLIISLPVFFSQHKRDMVVEVQLRTIAMDLWASLEHQLKYKRQVPDREQVEAEFKACADQIAQIDRQMLEIRQRIEAAEDSPSQADILIARLKKLDAPL